MSEETPNERRPGPDGLPQTPNAGDPAPAPNLSPEQRAAVLSEALPYIRKFNGLTVVIKYGGNAMIDDRLKNDFAKDVVLLKLVGMHPVVVHGGGPQINEMLRRVGKTGEFVQGMRVTDQETMGIVEMVLGGSVNKEIVSLLNLHGGKAIGLTGRDCHFMRARKLFVNTPDRNGVDIGRVGVVESVDSRLIVDMVGNGYIPVIAPIAVGPGGEPFNVNADLVAGKVACELKAKKLIMMTNTPGVLDKNGRLISRIGAQQVGALVADGTLTGGMLPKIGSAVEACLDGVEAAHILDGRLPHALLLELFTRGGIGTMISAKDAEPGENA